MRALRRGGLVAKPCGPCRARAFDAGFERRGQAGKRRIERVAARHQHVVMAGPHRKTAGEPHRLPEASPHSVSLDRVALPLGDRETDTGLAAVAPVAYLEKEVRSLAPLSGTHGEIFRPGLQPAGRLRCLVRSQWPCTPRAGGLRPRGACGRARGGPRAPCDRPWLRVARESRGAVCARAWKAGMYASSFIDTAVCGPS